MYLYFRSPAVRWGFFSSLNRNGNNYNVCYSTFMNKTPSIEQYPFINNELLFCQKSYFNEYGVKALYKQFRLGIGRAWSRNVMNQYAGNGIGLEIGVGERTIAPVSRTILSDAFESHGAASMSLAKVFFRADEIPYANGSFDFIFSEHTLEHLANPLKALFHWKEKLADGGRLILFLPHQERCCDIYRELTPLAHLVEDYEKNMPDDDQTHVDDFYENVVLKGLTPHYDHYNKEDLAASGNMHHHVWITEDLVELFQYVGLDVVFTEDCVPDRQDSFVIVGRK